MDQWERDFFDKLSTADVALELHMARVNHEKVQAEVNVLHTEAARLKRLWEAAEDKLTNAGYDAEYADDKVRMLEKYLNDRIMYLND